MHNHARTTTIWDICVSVVQIKIIFLFATSRKGILFLPMSVCLSSVCLPVAKISKIWLLKCCYSFAINNLIQ